MHGRLAEALEHAREAIAWDQDRAARADDLITLSEALAALGESDESRDAMKEAQCALAGQPAAGRGAGQPGGHERPRSERVADGRDPR